jgi:hypothetical protein
LGAAFEDDMDLLSDSTHRTSRRLQMKLEQLKDPNEAVQRLCTALENQISPEEAQVLLQYLEPVFAAPYQVIRMYRSHGVYIIVR